MLTLLKEKDFLQKNKNYFSGKELVDWMLASQEHSYMTRDDASHLCENMRSAGILISEKRKAFSDDTSMFKFDKTYFGSSKKTSSIGGELVSKVMNLTKKKENDEESQDEDEDDALSPTSTAPKPVTSSSPLSSSQIPTTTTTMSTTSTTTTAITTTSSTTTPPEPTPVSPQRQQHIQQQQLKHQQQQQQIHDLWKNPHVSQVSVFDPTTVPDTPEYTPTNWEELEKAILEFESNLN